jgi:hypothetical protein
VVFRRRRRWRRQQNVRQLRRGTLHLRGQHDLMTTPCWLRERERDRAISRVLLIWGAFLVHVFNLNPLGQR